MTESEAIPRLMNPRLRPAKTLVPILPGSDNKTLLALAKNLATSEAVLLLGVVPVEPGENLSAGSGPARILRRLINAQIDRVNLRALARIRVSFNPWDDIRFSVREEGSVELLVLDWETHLPALGLTAAELLSHPPCDVALIRGPLPEKLNRILVYNRGGPHAERALQLAINLARLNDATVTSLNVRDRPADKGLEATFAGMAQILEEMPDVEQRTIPAEDQIERLLEIAGEYDLLVLGTAAFPTKVTTSFGEITDSMLANAPAAVLAVKTKRVVPETASSGEYGAKAISVLVDRWFAENTFHADEFSNLKRLAALKEERGVRISVALPALNEEETVGEIIHTIKRSLMEQVHLVDELVLLDSDSQDRTREIAQSHGIPVYIHQELLPELGPRVGKGEALWKSLLVTEGDILIWVDTDIRNFHPRFVYGLIGPLLQRSSLKLVKGFYRRPLRTNTGLKPGRGGRVTELTARPLINLLYPGLSGIIQPLSGEYGARRDALERMVFSSGYGVETCLLIEAFEKYRLHSIAQVDLVERIHRNQSLANLSKMSFAIVQTVFNRLEKRFGREVLLDVNRTMKIIRYESGTYRLDVDEIGEYARPPMIEVDAYRLKRGYPPFEK